MKKGTFLILLIISLNASASNYYPTTENYCRNRISLNDRDRCLALIGSYSVSEEAMNYCNSMNNIEATYICIQENQFDKHQEEIQKRQEKLREENEKKAAELIENNKREEEEEEEEEEALARAIEKAKAELVIANEKAKADELIKANELAKTNEKIQMENELKIDEEKLHICEDKIEIYERYKTIDSNRSMKESNQNTPINENTKVIPK